MTPPAEEPPSPEFPVVDKNEFFFPGEGVSALLVHGLSGTPYEMRWLGEQLAAGGIRVRGVRLNGHAGSPEDLGASTYDNWYESVVQGLEDLRRHSDPNVVVGLSAGAVLAARLAVDQGAAIAGVAMLAPAFFLSWTATVALGAVRKLGKLANHLYLHNDSGSDIHDAAARRIHPTARLLPLSAPINLLDLSKMVRRRLERVTQPALMIYSRQDHTCPMGRNRSFVTRHLGTAERREVVLEQSYHVITVDDEKQQVAAEVRTFVEQFRVQSKRRAFG